MDNESGEFMEGDEEPREERSVWNRDWYEVVGEKQKLIPKTRWSITKRRDTVGLYDVHVRQHKTQDCNTCMCMWMWTRFFAAAYVAMLICLYITGYDYDLG